MNPVMPTDHSWIPFVLTFLLIDERAMALLPLAVEYQIIDLQKLYEHHLASAPSQHQNLYMIDGTNLVRMLKIAEELNLVNFKYRMINKCAALLPGKEIDRQWSLPENKGIPDKCYNQIIRYSCFIRRNGLMGSKHVKFCIVFRTVGQSHERLCLYEKLCCLA